jgi:hypothetical protein
MSLIETNTLDITKKQYFYKLKSNMRVFLSLMMFQLIAASFSITGNVSGNSGWVDGNTCSICYLALQ